MFVVAAVPSTARPCSCPIPEAPAKIAIQDGEELGPYDVICGRDKEAFNNIGNRRFRVTVSLTLGRYEQAQSRKEKSTVIKSVAILVQNNGGRFLQKKKGKWFALNEKQTHEKVGHALRDMAMATAKIADTKSEHVLPTPPEPTKSEAAVAPKRHSSTAQMERKMKRAKIANGTPYEEVPTASRSDFDEVCIVSSLPSDLKQTNGEEAQKDFFNDGDTILSWLMDESDQVLFEL